MSAGCNWTLVAWIWTGPHGTDSISPLRKWHERKAHGFEWDTKITSHPNFRVNDISLWGPFFGGFFPWSRAAIIRGFNSKINSCDISQPKKNGGNLKKMAKTPARWKWISWGRGGLFFFAPSGRWRMLRTQLRTCRRFGGGFSSDLRRSAVEGW